MKKWIAAMMVAVFAAFTTTAQVALEEWTFSEANGTSFTNLVNSGSEGLAHFGDDHFGTFVTNGALRFTTAGTNDCFRVGELTTSNLESGFYELKCTYTYNDLTENNAAFGVFLRSAETYSSATKTSTDLFQFRIHVVSGVPNIQTRVLQPDDNAGIENHLTLPTSATNVEVRLTVDLVNDTLDGEVIHAGTTNTFSRLILDIPADYIRVHGTSTKISGGSYVEFDDVQWSFIEESEPQDIVYVEYLMGDTNGAPIGALAQTGTDPNSFGSSSTAPGIFADGLGALVFTNLTENEFSGHNLGTALTNQIVELEFKLSAWDLAAISESGNNFGFELRDKTSSGGLKITVDQKAAGTRINWVGADAPRQVLSVSNGVDLVIKAQIDLTAGTFAAFYDEGNGWVLKAKDQSLGAGFFDQFRLVADGTPTWGAGAFANVDYVKVVLPKPKKLIDFQFSDAANAALNTLWNNGLIATNWNFGGGSEIFADGSGNLEFRDVTNTYTRKVTFAAAPLTNNTITMQWRLDAWELQGLAGSDGLTLALSDTVNAKTVKSKFFLTGDALDTRMTMTDAANAGKQKAGFGITNGADGVSFRLVNDLEAETFHGYYKFDSDPAWTEVTESNTVGLARIDEILLTVNPGWAGDKTGFADVDYLTVTSVENVATGPETAQEWYDDWAAGFAGFTDTATTNNPDGDSVNNLYEYGLGGDPTLASSVGYESTLTDSGAGYLEYVHVQRSDADVRGLSYHLELTESLTIPSWTNAYYTVAGTNLNVEVGFDAVTNHISTATKNVQFIRLIIGSSGIAP